MNIYKKLFLKEIKIIKNNKNEENRWLYYKGYLFLFSDIENLINNLPEKFEKLKKIIKDNDFQETILPEVISGTKENNILIVFDDPNESVSPINMLNIKKIARSLNCKFYKFFGLGNDTIYYVEDKKKDIDKVSKIFYHGTNSNSVLTILKQGISPQKKTNFNKINHTNKVFITSNKEYSYFYAELASKKHGGFPVVIEIQEIDENLLVQDYDYYRIGTRQEWELDSEYDEIINMNESRSATRRSKDYGVFGYKGKILPQKIKSFYYVKSIEYEYYSYWISKEDLIKSIENFNELSFILGDNEAIELFNEGGPENIEVALEELEEEEEEEHLNESKEYILLYHIGKTPAIPNPSRRSNGFHRNGTIRGVDGEKIAFFSTNYINVAINHGIIGNVYVYRAPKKIIKYSGGTKRYDHATEIIINEENFHLLEFLGKKMSADQLMKEIKNELSDSKWVEVTRKRYGLGKDTGYNKEEEEFLEKISNVISPLFLERRRGEFYLQRLKDNYRLIKEDISIKKKDINDKKVREEYISKLLYNVEKYLDNDIIEKIYNTIL